MSEREILFRGKRVDNGRWVEGYLSFVYIDVPEKARIYSPAKVRSFDVITETVGQYTGLTDKNGTRIFEGDIVTCNYFCGVVCFHEGAWCVTERDKYPEDLCDLINLEVIGNIHDNPELLEGDA